MRKTILLMALMVLIGGADAFAQGSSSVSKNSGGGGNAGGGGVIQAPVGHRQPTAKDVPPGFQDNYGVRSLEDEAIDRKLRICRDC